MTSFVYLTNSQFYSLSVNVFPERNFVLNHTMKYCEQFNFGIFLQRFHVTHIAKLYNENYICWTCVCLQLHFSGLWFHWFCSVLHFDCVYGASLLWWNHHTGNWFCDKNNFFIDLHATKDLYWPDMIWLNYIFVTFWNIFVLIELLLHIVVNERVGFNWMLVTKISF